MRILFKAFLLSSCTSFVWAAMPKDSKVDSVHSQVKKEDRELLDGIVLKVGKNGAILHSDVEATAEELSWRNIPKELVYPASPEAPVEERALEFLTNQRLIRGACEENGLQGTSSQVDTQISNIIKGNPKLNSEADLEKALQTEGKTLEDFRSEIADQFCLRNFRGRFVIPYVKVTEADLKPYYFLKTGEKAESVTATVNTLSFDSKKEAQKAYKELSGGVSFGEVAKKYLGGAASEQEEYDINSLASDEMRDALEELQIGDFTDPVEAAGTFYIFELVSKKSTLALGFDAVALKAEYVAEKSSIEMESQLQKLRLKHHLKVK